VPSFVRIVLFVRIEYSFFVSPVFTYKFQKNNPAFKQQFIGH